jgi:RND family efflux transporter MFP subunit
LINYTRITAPFDGIITRRYADPGSLIQAGTSSDTQSKPLVRLSDNYHLRLDFPVSVAYVKEIRMRDSVEIQVESLNDRALTGLISRFSQKIDDTTRTMLTEIEVENPDLELIPGMYATLSLKVQRRPQALTVPTDAILPGAPPAVYLVDSNLLTERRSVSLGLETPGKVEVTSGLKDGDQVIVGGFSKLTPGQKVEPKPDSPVVQQRTPH